MERRCSFNGCPDPVKARGLCNQHYKQLRVGKLGKTRERLHRMWCAAEGCPNPHEARGYCNKHYKQWRAGRIGKTRVRDGSQGCLIPGCSNAHEAKGFCYKHYKQSKRGTVSANGQSNGAAGARQRCRVAGCEALASSRGYCVLHRKRLRQLMKSYMACHVALERDGRLEPYEVYDFSRYTDEKWNGDDDFFLERVERALAEVLRHRRDDEG